jgi:hypothetical protein
VNVCLKVLLGCYIDGELLTVRMVGETGVKRDTGSKGTVGGKIVDVNKTVKIFSMLCKSV